MSHPNSDCYCPACPTGQPLAGPVTGQCKYCGGRKLRIDHLREYTEAPPGGWGDKFDRLADACRACGAGDLHEDGTLEVVAGSLAGAQAKVPAREIRRVGCECGFSAAVVRWAWMVCVSCGHRSRGEATRP